MSPGPPQSGSVRYTSFSGTLPVEPTPPKTPPTPTTPKAPVSSLKVQHRSRLQTPRWDDSSSTFSKPFSFRSRRSSRRPPSTDETATHQDNAHQTTVREAEAHLTTLIVRRHRFWRKRLWLRRLRASLDAPSPEDEPPSVKPDGEEEEHWVSPEPEPFDRPSTVRTHVNRFGSAARSHMGTLRRSRFELRERDARPSSPSLKGIAEEGAESSCRPSIPAAPPMTRGSTCSAPDEDPLSPSSQGSPNRGHRGHGLEPRQDRTGAILHMRAALSTDSHRHPGCTHA